MIQVEKTQLDGVLLIKPQAAADHRGFYLETYNEELYREHGINVKFIQDDISVSKKNVLRGLHGDFLTWKLISCLYGEFYFVVMNGDPKSPRFGQWQSFILSDENKHQVLIPPGHGNGHVVLSEKAIFHYKQTTYYNAKLQFTYCWNDPRFHITWPVTDPILSDRDRLGYFPKTN